MKKTTLVIAVLFVTQSFAQSSLQKFFNLSAPKRMWVLFHPFQAKKALEISRETNKVADSIKKTDLLDKDAAGGQVDAFRHGYWMARLRQEIGKSAARSLGRAHERENYLMYKKRKLEDGIVPDEISSKMDLYNNEIGLSLTVKGSKISKKALVFRVINAIYRGEMKIIKKNKKKYFLTCDEKIIKRSSLKGKWKNNKCLVFSNIKSE